MPDVLEIQRSQSARHYIWEAGFSERLHPILALAARALGFSRAMVNILENDTQHTITVLGGELSSSPREESLCNLVVNGNAPLVIEDARLGSRYMTYPPVAAGQVGCYIGVPLVGRESVTIGAVCVFDREAQPVDPDQLDRLVEFGKIVEDQLDLMRSITEQRELGPAGDADLAAAISNGDIVTLYQPIIDLATGATYGQEALAQRIGKPGVLDGTGFSARSAQETELVIELDLAVMKQAMTDLRLWQRHTPSARVGVDLSARHFEHPDWRGPILGTVLDAGVAPTSVDLELTESSRLLATDVGGRVVKELQENGFRVWLDGFGADQASLEYLLRLSADGVKIDRAVSAALGSQAGDALTRAVTRLAGELGISTMMEGIETERNAVRAAALGCEFGQGSLWSTPIPAAEVTFRPAATDPLH